MTDPMQRFARLLRWDAPKAGSAAPVQGPRTFAALLAFAGWQLGGRDVIRVGGTNGKGSTCAMLEACLCAAGLRVGLTTSPHLERPTERIRVGGSEVSEAELERCAAEVFDVVSAFVRRHPGGAPPTYFQVMTLAALRAFLDADVQVAVVEAGVGGATDITSVLPARLAVLTTIALDHTEQLGGTREQIARNKAGIASRHSTLLLGPAIGDDLAAVIARESAPRGVRLVRVGKEVARRVAAGDVRMRVRAGGREHEVEVALRGAFQAANVACVAASLEELAGRGVVASIEQSLRGLSAVRWPGRFEHVAGPPPVLLDVAHNPEGLAALADALDADFAAVPRTLVFGASAAKDVAALLADLGRIAPTVHLTDGFYQAQPAGELAGLLRSRFARVCTYPTVDRALDAALAWAARRVGMVVVAGSVYLVGAGRAALRRRGLDLG